MLHKFHPHRRKIHAFLSVFLAFHGKTTSFLIYYKMKTTFTFENFSIVRALVLQSKKALTRYIYG